MKSIKVLSLALAGVIASSANASVVCPSGFSVGAELATVLSKYDGKYSEGNTVIQDGSRNKTSFLASLLLGYDFQVGGNMMIGFDVLFGVNFAGKAKLYGTKDFKYNEADGKCHLQIKRQWSGEFTPRFGWMVTPACEIYLKGGINVTRYKLSMYDDDGNRVENATFPGGSKLEGKTKVAPVVGCGVRYNFTENLGIQVGYSFIFKTNLDNDKKTDASKSDATTGKLKTQAHKFGVAAFYRF